VRAPKSLWSWPRRLQLITADPKTDRAAQNFPSPHVRRLTRSPYALLSRHGGSQVHFISRIAAAYAPAPAPLLHTAVVAPDNDRHASSHRNSHPCMSYLTPPSWARPQTTFLFCCETVKKLTSSGFLCSRDLVGYGRLRPRSCPGAATTSTPPACHTQNFKFWNVTKIH
jgi:hypothetical protein